MYTDMVGYTALGQRNESLSLALVEEQRKLIRPILARHNGREIKTIGDAFLVEFPNALDAVRCAYDIQRATREFNISLPMESRIHLRVGLHLGDVVESGGDISGDAVNVASRIEPLAEDGGVCLTRQVFDHVSNKFELPLSSLGPKALKNVSEPLEVFRIMMPWEKETVEPLPQLESKRIAVLPFVSMSPDPNDEYFADGLTEELITRISLVRGLEVIARTSAMNYKKKEKNASQIGRELKVGTLLEGSVRKAGNRIRVSAQLIDANTEGHLWAESYDRNLEDIFEVQSSVAENVAGALKLKLLDEERQRVESTADMEAYTMYLRAMQLFHELNPTSCREAISLFEGAVSRDSKFARAYAGLAHAWYQMSTWEDFTVSVSRAEAAARKALELGPESAEAHSAMGAIHNAMDRFDESRLELERAIRINPNLAEANLLLAAYYEPFGRFDEAMSFVQKARSLDPLDPDPALYMTILLRVTGKVDDALAVVERLKEVHRRVPWVYFQAALCYLQKRDFTKALDTVDVGLRFNPDEHNLRTARGVAFALSGRREEALDELRDLMKDEAESHRIDAQYWIRTALGDFEAFEALMRAAELHAWWPLIKYESFFEGLRKDPRFSEFCKKVGLPP
jgi:TolB-like protein/Flp pilus assembly protein TadD